MATSVQNYTLIEENITKDFQGLAKKPCDDALALQMVNNPLTNLTHILSNSILIYVYFTEPPTLYGVITVNVQ